MSMDKINEYYFKRTLKKNKKDLSIMLGFLIERMLKLNRLGKFSFYFIYFYLFLYEMRKVLEIIRLIVFVNGNFYNFLTVLQFYFDYNFFRKVHFEFSRFWKLCLSSFNTYYSVAYRFLFYCLFLHY